MPDLAKYRCTDMVYRRYGRHNLLRLGVGFAGEDVSIDQVDIVREQYSFSYVFSGAGRFVDADGREYPLGPGAVFQRLPGVRHSTYVVPGSGYGECFLELGREWYEAALRSEMGFLDAPSWTTPPNLRHLETIWELKEQLRIAAAGDYGDVVAQILVIIQRIHADFRWRDRSLDLARREQLIAAARLLADPREIFRSIEQIAFSLALGPETFRRAFKAYYGMSPVAFRIRSRIDAACGLLRQGGRPVKEVAERLGYPDIYSFSRQFKKITGYSPRRYAHGGTRIP